MAIKTRSKKNEALEIRVSHEEKQAFMHAVSKRGTTASSVIRDAMMRYTGASPIRRDKMHKRLMAGSLVAGIALVSIGGWEIAQRSDFGTAYAEDIASSFQLRIEASEDEARHVFRTSMRILISPGETRELKFESVSQPVLQAILPPDAGVVEGTLTAHVTLSEPPESNLYMYRINLTVTDSDGVVHETSINPAVATQMDSPASIESRFGTEAEIFINLIPLSVEG